MQELCLEDSHKAKQLLSEIIELDINLSRFGTGKTLIFLELNNSKMPAVSRGIITLMSHNNKTIVQKKSILCAFCEINLHFYYFLMTNITLYILGYIYTDFISMSSYLFC